MLNPFVPTKTRQVVVDLHKSGNGLERGMQAVKQSLSRIRAKKKKV